LPQSFSRSHEAHLERWNADADLRSEDLHNNTIGTSNKQTNDLFIFVGHRGKHEPNLSHALDVSMGIIVGHEIDGLLKRILSAYRVAAKLISGGIGGDTPDPGRKGARLLERIKAGPRFDRDILGEIAGGFFTTHTTREECRRHSAAVGFEQFLERFMIARP